jgi:hypothetical protein
LFSIKLYFRDCHSLLSRRGGGSILRDECMSRWIKFDSKQKNPITEYITTSYTNPFIPSTVPEDIICGAPLPLSSIKMNYNHQLNRQYTLLTTCFRGFLPLSPLRRFVCLCSAYLCHSFFLYLSFLQIPEWPPLPLLSEKLTYGFLSSFSPSNLLPHSVQ